MLPLWCAYYVAVASQTWIFVRHLFKTTFAKVLLERQGTTSSCKYSLRLILSVQIVMTSRNQLEIVIGLKSQVSGIEPFR